MSSRGDPRAIIEALRAGIEINATDDVCILISLLL